MPFCNESKRGSYPPMDSYVNGFVLDPSKCNKLTMEEKQELLCEISKWSEGAAELLHSWTRREILEVICATMGKERKYTGRPKAQMIEHLLKLISEKRHGHNDDTAQSASPPKLETESAQSASPSKPMNAQGNSKRQRKAENPSRLAVDVNSSLCCQNLACRAILDSKDIFCKMCSCCICHKYDDNKDPGLWLVCQPDHADSVDACGMSCHLECALNNERTGIAKIDHTQKLDGAFFCLICGKINELIGSWRNQLLVAKDARRVDTLCHRLSLCHKLLFGTFRYQKLHEIVDLAAKKLEEEVGTLDGSHIRMARGIVNRLACGYEVQKLCASAIEAADSMHSMGFQVHSNFNRNFQPNGIMPPKMIQFEEVSSTSITMLLYSGDVTSCMIWHRKSDFVEYVSQPTCELSKSKRRFCFQNLVPTMEYHFRIVAFVEATELGSWETTCATSCAVRDVMMEDSTRGAAANWKSSDDIEDPGNLTFCKANETANDQSVDAEMIQQGEQDATSDPLSSRAGLWVPPLNFHNVFSDETSIHEDLDGGNGDCGWKPVKKDCKSSLRSGQSLDDSHLADLPCTPCKLEAAEDICVKTTRTKLENQCGDSPAAQFLLDVSQRNPQPGSSSKKSCSRRVEGRNGRILPCFMQPDHTKYSSGLWAGDYEYCVKVIRRLECEGHIAKEFRLKFLTWFSLTATAQEKRIVRVFVDTLIDDPAGLAGQLVDTFLEGIWGKGSAVPDGLCKKLSC